MEYTISKKKNQQNFRTVLLKIYEQFTRLVFRLVQMKHKILKIKLMLRPHIQGKGTTDEKRRQKRNHLPKLKKKLETVVKIENITNSNEAFWT